MKAGWVLVIPLISIHGPKTSRFWFIIPCPVVIHSQVGVPLLAGVAVVVDCRAGGGEEVAEGVVVVGVGDGGIGGSEHAHAPLAVIAVVADGGAALLADEGLAPGVGDGRGGAVGRGVFGQHLGVAAGVAVVNQVVICHAIDGFADPVAVGVVNDSDRVAPRDEPVFGVVRVARQYCVSVGVAAGVSDAGPPTVCAFGVGLIEAVVCKAAVRVGNGAVQAVADLVVDIGV